MVPERETRITFLRHPVLTTKYFIFQLLHLVNLERRVIRNNRRLSVALIFVIIVLAMMYVVEGPHSAVVNPLISNCIYFVKWIGLGVLSSIGLGTGLHTFVLYLGPFISSVTLAAWECNSVDFPSPPYPDDIICPEVSALGQTTVLAICSKVKWECFTWGVGTALGELPPYLMARAAAKSSISLSGQESHDPIGRPCAGEQGVLAKAKAMVPVLVEKAGFLGILMCASIPNPLFDLAGITCGHCMIPFWTFFGATFLGKAVIKVSLQSMFVILCFSPTSYYYLIQLLERVPVVGSRAVYILNKAVSIQKDKLHKGSPNQHSGPNLLIWVFHKFILIMVIYFIISIVNSLAQSYVKRLRSNVA